MIKRKSRIIVTDDSQGFRPGVKLIRNAEAKNILRTIKRNSRISIVDRQRFRPKSHPKNDL